MSCLVAFQISRTTPLAYWFYDKNLSDILSNGRIISFSRESNIFVDCEAKIENTILHRTNVMQTHSFLNFLHRNNKNINDITSYYFTYDLNFSLIEQIEEVPELEEVPRLERQSQITLEQDFLPLDVSAISENAQTPIIADFEDENDLDLETLN